jgi:hypothetical protein
VESEKGENSFAGRSKNILTALIFLNLLTITKKTKNHEKFFKEIN